jgi:hypothetical protein
MSTVVSGYRLKAGKLTRVFKMSVSKKIGNKAKADRKEVAWKAKSK